MKKILIFLTFFILFEAFPQELPDNLPEELIEEIKTKRIGFNNSNQAKFQDFSIDNENEDSEAEENDFIENKIFGIDFIRSVPKSISATSDLPVPNDYIISLNDEIKVILSGSKKNIYNLPVGLDGTILFPELGIIQVAGDTFFDVKNKLKRLISSSYIGVEIDISLSSLAAKKINVLGAVKMPGTYLVNPFTTISNSLAYSGGIEDYSSLRNITLIRGSQKFSFDLYDLLVFGDRSKDLNIESGDTVLVKATSNHVEISGEVFRPMTYEYAEDDSFADLINFALGLNADAESKNITSTVLENGRRYSMSTKLDEVVGSKKLSEVYIGKQVRADDKDLFVTGSGVTSGYYSTTAKQFSDLLADLKFSSDIYPFYATYKNTLANGLVRNISAFALSDPDTYKNLSVTKNSQLNFYDRGEIINNESLKDINPRNLVSITFPGRTIKIPVKGKISPQQIYAFFEINSDIDYDKVSVVTTNKSYINAFEIAFDSEELVAISFPPDTVQNLIEVTVEGEVVNPGKYIIASSSTLDSLYNLAGGLRSDAFDRGIALLRQDVKQKQIAALKQSKAVLTDAIIQKSNSISPGGMLDIEAILQLAELAEPTGRVAGLFSPNSDLAKEFLLKDGDTILIPSKSLEVVVQGEVLNSSSFIYDDSSSLQDYLESAGGLTEYADKRAIFIVKANGMAVPAALNMFSKQVEIEAGDTIIVPRNLNKLETLPLISIATKIISDIAFSAASLNAIKD